MTRYPMYGMVGGTQGRSGWVRKISHPPNRPPRSATLYGLSYADPTLSEDICSNVLFIRIRSRIFPNSEYKDAVPHRFTVIDLRSSFDRLIVTCVLTVRSQFSFCFSKINVEGTLYLKNQAARQEHILSLWCYNFALVGCVRILTEHV